MKLVFYSSTITMMHGPINIKWFKVVSHFRFMLLSTVRLRSRGLMTARNFWVLACTI